LWTTAAARPGTPVRWMTSLMIPSSLAIAEVTLPSEIGTKETALGGSWSIGTGLPPPGAGLSAGRSSGAADAIGARAAVPPKAAAAPRKPRRPRAKVFLVVGSVDTRYLQGRGVGDSRAPRDRAQWSLPPG